MSEDPKSANKPKKDTEPDDPRTDMDQGESLVPRDKEERRRQTKTNPPRKER